MRKRIGSRTRIRLAAERVEQQLNQHSGGMYARGLSREGYLGGYAQALADVQLVLSGIVPNTRGLWDDPE